MHDTSVLTKDTDGDVLALLYGNDPALTEEFRLANKRLMSRDEPILSTNGSPERIAAPLVAHIPSLHPSSFFPHVTTTSRHREQSTVFFLSMIQYDAGLMYTTARLYLHLCSTVERKRLGRLEEVRRMQQRQEEELSAVLSMVDAGTMPLLASPVAGGAAARSQVPLVVDSACTESVFQRHAAEVSELEIAHKESSVTAVLEANEQFHSFLKAAAPDYVSHKLQSAIGDNKSTADKRDSPVAAAGSFLSVSDLLLLPNRPVDVLVLRIVNPLRGQVVGARPKDPTLAPIILECSPLDRLGDCNALCLKKYIDEDHQERWARRVQDHLGRIAGGHHSVLLLIGNQEEAKEWLGLTTISSESAVAEGTSDDRLASDDQATTLPPELLLPLPPEDCSGGWAALAGNALAGSELLGMSTSRLYAANYILLFDPTTESQRVGSSRCDVTIGGLGKALRDGLHYATSHGANRLSVAVLPTFGSASHPKPTSRRRMHGDDDVKPISGDAAVMYELHHAVATVQLALNCGKPPTRTGLHIAGLLHYLSEHRMMPPTIAAATGVASFNLSMAVRVFVSSHPMELAAAEAFQQDVEVVARIPVIQ
ncbi:GPI-anchored surface protein, putative [Bodo saltans]|uniref:GPI-anchored surface protein, putative n=1 Tax=Bodo saltans TaxID=75058 RepID=A0A0S4JLU9_BODSA|nr:GPI-anchored surface protein, putative [Bodo saltans]|eukprot:CUG91609.1 GPI-anchored surface protein, putative [Bodo saltans]